MTGPNPIGALFGGPPDPAAHALLDALPGGVGIFTLDGTLVMANRAYRELAGAPVGAGAGDLLRLIVLQGQGHNFHEGFFRSQECVDFAVARARVGAR